jgi:hypothetical protein
VRSWLPLENICRKSEGQNRSSSKKLKNFQRLLQVYERSNNHDSKSNILVKPMEPKVKPTSFKVNGSSI